MYLWKLETVDPSVGSSLVHFAFASSTAPLHLGTTEIRGQHTQQGMVHRRYFCVYDHTYITMGNLTTSSKLHPARTAEANHQDTLDGSYLQSGQLACSEVPQYCYICGYLQRML